MISVFVCVHLHQVSQQKKDDFHIDNHGFTPYRSGKMDTPLAANENQLDRLRSLAEKFDCITETDLMLLAKVTDLTVEAWRKRGVGPDYIVVGKRVLYPRAAVAEYLEGLTRSRTSLGKEALL